MLWIIDLKGASDDEGNDQKKYRGSLICSVLVMLIGVLVGFTSTQSMWANVLFCSDGLCAGGNNIL